MKLNDVTRGSGLEEHGIANAHLIYWTSPTASKLVQMFRKNFEQFSATAPPEIASVL